MTTSQWIAGVWRSFTTKEASVSQEIGYIDDKLKAAEREVVTHALHGLASIRVHLDRIEQKPDLTWKELQMALADVIQAAADEITKNTASFEALITAAKGGNTAALEAQIATLQAELDAANAAAANLTTNTAAQTAAANPTPPPAALAFANADLPAGTVGTAYSASVAATGGTPPITYSGTASDGLTVNADGTITGTPTAAGTFSFSVTATDSTGAAAAATFTVTFA